MALIEEGGGWIRTALGFDFSQMVSTPDSLMSLFDMPQEHHLRNQGFHASVTPRSSRNRCSRRTG